MKLQSPYPYFGGKSTVIKDVWTRLGKTDVYVEPFLGSAAMFLGNPYWPHDTKEFLNDAWGFIPNFWRAVQAKPEEVARYADLPIYESQMHAVHAVLAGQRSQLSARLEGDLEYFDAKIAGQWVWLVSMWIGQGCCSGRGAWSVDLDEEGYKVLVKKSREDAENGIARQRQQMTSQQGIMRSLPEMASERGVRKDITRQLMRMTGEDGVVSRKRFTGHAGPVDLYDWMQMLSDRFRDARVLCGDWSRCVTPSLTTYHGVAAVFCLHPDTPIRMENERLVPVKEINQGDMLHGSRIVQRVMTRVCQDEQVLSIGIQGMPDTVRVTTEHRIPRIPGRTHGRQETRSHKELWNAIEVVPSSELKIGDYLLVPHGGFEKDIAWHWDVTLKGNGTRQKQVIFNPTDDIWRLLGYYAAEGYIVRSKSGNPLGINLSFSRDEEHTYVADVTRIVKDVFGIDTTLRWHNKGTINVYVGSAPVGKFFDYYVPGMALNKRLHDDLMVLSPDKQLEILIGWMRGDGGICYSSRNRCKLTGTSSSNDFARQMFAVAIRCGLRPSFKTRRNSERFVTYDVCFASEDAVKLGWSVPAKKFKSTRKIINGHHLVRITSIESELYTGVVYDLDVDKDDMFGAPFVLVHNCDPPYSDGQREGNLYAEDSFTVAHDVRKWCLENGDNPQLRIALCGYSSEHDELEDLGWERFEWKANGGYGNQGKSRDAKGKNNATREVIWFSPHCLRPDTEDYIQKGMSFDEVYRSDSATECTEA